MPNASKTLVCPFCIHPLSLTSYIPHVQTCREDEDWWKILTARLRCWEGIVWRSLENNKFENLVDEYRHFISYSTAFFETHWCQPQTVNSEFFDVPLDCREAFDIIKAVEKTVTDVRIKKIERLQNKELFLQYLEFKDSHDGHEKYLFHGSSEKIYNLICNQGFDIGHSKSGAYGYGIYLSSTMSYSLAYTLDTKSMLLCRAYITDDCSVHGNIHVFHNDFSIYPNYVIYY